MKLKQYKVSGITDYLVILGIIIMWFILPVPVMIIMLVSLCFSSIFVRHRRILYLVISLTFALLAYTQESINDTDIVRYYSTFISYENVELSNITFYNVLRDKMYFVFNPISIFIVSFFGSVQFFSLFWIFIVYFFYFLGIENYCAYRKIELSRNHLLLFVFLSIFGFILFTQVSEIIKQAVATSVFFYGFSLLLLKKKLSALIVIIVSIGIHSSVLLFIPILFYKCLNFKISRIVLIIAVIMSFFNIMQFTANILPQTGVLSLLQEKASSYTEQMWTDTSLVRYDLLMIISFLMLFLLKQSNKEYVNTKTIFIPYIYLCLILINRNVAHNYIRYVNMSYIVYAILFIEYINTRRILVKDFKAYFELLLIIAFLIANLHMTYYRTIGGSYLSSYMDNSLIQILGSSVYDYLSFKTI